MRHCYSWAAKPVAALALLALTLANGCDWDYERMIDQPNARDYEPSRYLPGGATLQPAPAGTVSREAPVGSPALRTGMIESRYVEALPIDVTEEILERGRNRFDIFCATCHGALADGESEVAENMKLLPPPSLHQSRIRNFPAGRLFAVASNGYGLMPAYRDRISLTDRWALVAYLQVLQLSQYALLEDLPPPFAREARQWLK